MSEQSNKVSPALVAIGVGVILVVGIAVGRAVVLRAQSQPTEIAGGTGSTAAAAPLRYKIPVTKTQPSRGPTDALVTVVQFCDLRGKACRQADAAMQSSMERFDGRLRWVHRHRLDPERLIESRRMHEFARAAFQHADKFWETRARFLAIPDGRALSDADFERIAREVGLDYASIEQSIAARHYDMALALDQNFSRKFGVDGVLEFFVNGRPLRAASGANLGQALARLIEQELVVAGELVERGVAQADVYRELTKDGEWGVGEHGLSRRVARASEQR